MRLITLTHTTGINWFGIINLVGSFQLHCHVTHLENKCENNITRGFMVWKGAAPFKIHVLLDRLVEQGHLVLIATRSPGRTISFYPMAA